MQVTEIYGENIVSKTRGLVNTIMGGREMDRTLAYYKLSKYYMIAAFMFVGGLYYLGFTSIAGSFAGGLGSTAALGRWYLLSWALSIGSLVFIARRLRQGKKTRAVYFLTLPIGLLCYGVYEVSKVLAGLSFMVDSTAIGYMGDCISIVVISVFMIAILTVLVGVYHGIRVGRTSTSI